MFFIFDSNTLISAILKPAGIPAKAVSMAVEKGILCFSSETVKEFLEVIGRAKFDKYLSFKEREMSAQQILSKAEIHRVNNLPGISCRDPFDIKFLTLAVIVKASCIVSGDSHLKELHPFHGIPVLSPSDFLIQF